MNRPEPTDRGVSTAAGTVPSSDCSTRPESRICGGFRAFAENLGRPRAFLGSRSPFVPAPPEWRAPGTGSAGEEVQRRQLRPVHLAVESEINMKRILMIATL